MCCHWSRDRCGMCPYSLSPHCSARTAQHLAGVSLLFSLWVGEAESAKWVISRQDFATHTNGGQCCTLTALSLGPTENLNPRLPGRQRSLWSQWGLPEFALMFSRIGLGCGYLSCSWLDSFYCEGIKVIFLSSINAPATANRPRAVDLIHHNYSLNKFNILVQTATNKFSPFIPQARCEP